MLAAPFQAPFIHSSDLLEVVVGRSLDAVALAVKLAAVAGTVKGACGQVHT